VIVRQRGGADGLSMVVPWGDRDYYRRRPTIAVPAPGASPWAAVDLDGFFGLHPRLAPLVPLYRDGTLGIVHGIGHAEAEHSHLTADERLDALIRSAAAGSALAADAHAFPPAGYPSSPFGRALAQAAREVKAGTGPRVLVADSWEWDHHSGQREPEGPLARSLDDLASGLAALARDLGSHLAGTTIVTVSEFGRSVRENGHGGTEHGHATAMLVIGGGVRRGRVEGAWRGLEREPAGLPATTALCDALRSMV
jgi:uncharacterized protein (DUF1501 family)